MGTANLIMVSALSPSNCRACIGVSNVSLCARLNDTCGQFYIYIENTDEGKAKYIAAKLTNGKSDAQKN
jgi:hypothetical protein